MIRIEFNTEIVATRTTTMQVPYDAKIVFAHDTKGYLQFAYEIHGRLFKPQLADIRKCQRAYGVKSYKVVGEYLKGETLRLIPVTF